ncbi:MAG: hypothetical protein IJY01_02885 [Clostridia bacterium]|nr:hypothetical protein [Clostridia bacterium]
MSENRNNYCQGSPDRRGIVIDTNRVLDACRDRDCFEDARVYLSTEDEGILASATNLRAISSEILYAYVGVDAVPFNCGFYRVSVRYFVVTELECCVSLGRSQRIKGISVLEKDVILFGGADGTTSFVSDSEAGYCSYANPDTRRGGAPTATVEVVEPVILGTKIKDASCPCPICECIELPECVCGCIDGTVNTSASDYRLYISLGIFSVIRITRPEQLLINATDFSVPDKECIPATSDENPCSLFRSMEFPTDRFKGGSIRECQNTPRRGKGCGCQ